MIKRYMFGTVFETEAVLNKPEESKDAFPYFQIDEEAMTFSYDMAEADVVYGLRK